MKIVRELLSNFRNNKRYIALLLILVSILSYVSVRVFVITGKIIDYIGDYNKFFKYIVIFIIVLIVQFLLQELLKTTEKVLAFKIAYQIKAMLYEKLINIKYEVLNKWTQDDLFQMWNSDIEEIQVISISAVTQFLIKSVSAIIATVQLYSIEPIFAITAVIFYFVTIIPIHIISKKNKLASQKLREATGAVNRSFFEIIDFVKLIKTYGKELTMLQKFDEANETYNIRKVNQLIVSNFFRMLSRVLNAIAPAIIIIIESYKIYNKSVTIGDIVISISLLAIIQAPFSEIGNFVVQLKAITFKIERVYSFLHSEEEELFLSNNKSIGEKDLCGDIEFQDVYVERLNKNIISSISLNIKNGEKVAIVGESGSGKTTIANLMIRLFEPNRGAIMINNTNVRDYGIAEYRKNIMYVQSDVYILNASVMENLELLGAKSEDIYSVAKEIRFHEHILNMENGYNAVLNSKGTNLSGGQRKKLGFIRGVSVPRSIYILDEITTGLDQESTQNVINYIINKIKSTVILITHDLESAKLMDKIVVLKNGCVIDIGSHEEVFSRCEYYRELQTIMGG